MKKSLLLLLLIASSASTLLAQSSTESSPKSDVFISQEATENVNIVATITNVTVNQYCNFLNSVAISDPHHLYNERIELDQDAASIIRAGTPDNYSYSVIEGRGELPMIHVNLFGQARYCNWVENSQPVGAQGKETTENGVYTLNGNEVVSVNPNAMCCLSDEHGETLFSLSSISYHLLYQSSDGGFYIRLLSKLASAE
ncbi:MAG TPA: hypothetical protein VJK54_03690 [Chthoniobacterales bacterium]|nr:hypothetical protein [Chthoniobacterales bacterium]